MLGIDNGNDNGLEQVAKDIAARIGVSNLIGRDPAFLEVISRIPVLAKTDATVLIVGETGVGKELCARALHYLGKRASMPFLPVNCGALPANLIESELFGHTRGAFTDARAARTGLVAEANSGTLFLDEIEALGFEAQSTLLRLLQNKTYRPLGQTKEVSADIRFITATNVDLGHEISKGTFRSDLFYRLTITLRVPALRERRSDIPLLAAHFARKYAFEFGRPPRRLTDSAVAKLMSYEWPGNIRELENKIQEAVLFSGGDDLDETDILIESKPVQDFYALPFSQAKKAAVEKFERAYLTRMLVSSQGNLTRAASLARKDRSDFTRMVHKHGIDVERIKKVQ